MGYFRFWTRNDVPAQNNSKIVINMRAIMEMITAIDEGIIFVNSRLKPTSVNPKFVGKNSKTEVMKPTKLQAPIT